MTESPLTDPTPAAKTPLLEVRDLHVEFDTRAGVVPALRGVSYALPYGKTLAVVGESGSGKSVTARAMMGLLPRKTSRITKGEVLLEGTDVLRQSEESFRRVRGERLAIVFQDALSALNPVQPVGFQIAEGWRMRGGHSRADAKKRAVELMDQVGIPGAARRVGDFPHEFSGGMRQRVMIATALAQDPDVLIADEPTTALDVTIQAQILRLLAELQAQRQMGLVMITHDMGVVANIADEIAVMNQGVVVEHGACAEVLRNPQHPYTTALLGAIPRPELRGHPLPTVATAMGDGSPEGQDAAQPEVGTSEVAKELGEPRFRSDAREGEVVLQVNDLVKTYPGRRGLGRSSAVTAVDGVSFELRRGKTLGLVGESGCGKSTVAKILVAIEDATQGQVEVLGRSLAGLRGKALKQARRDIQLVFQDPYTSLNPRMTVADCIREPLEIHPDIVPRNGRDRRVQELLEMVGLDREFGARFPFQLSGGQRQRVGIARALALEPQILVLDEPVSALDVSVQAQVINLLSDLQVELGLSYVFIAHDLGVVAHMSDEIAVMYLGRIVERGSYEEVYTHTAHPFTDALMRAVPEPDPSHREAFLAKGLQGETPDPSEIPNGCRFSARCERADVVCLSEPGLIPVRDVAEVREASTGSSAEASAGAHQAGTDSTHRVACHHPMDGDWRRDEALARG